MESSIRRDRTRVARPTPTSRHTPPTTHERSLSAIIHRGVLAVFVVCSIGTMTACAASPLANDSRPEQSERPVLNRGIIVDADASGAVVLQSGYVVLEGISRDTGSVWLDSVSADRRFVSCVRTCPSAVASGTSTSDDSSTPAYSAYWHLPDDGYARRLSFEDGSVLTAVDEQHLVELTDAGNLVVSDPDPGNFRVGSFLSLSTSVDRRRQLLVSSFGTVNNATLIEWRDSKWLVQSNRTQANGGCISSSSVAYISGQNVRVHGPWLLPITITALNVGGCVVTHSSLLTVVLQDASGHATTTVTSYSLPSARAEWTHVVTGLSLPSRSVTANETVMVSNGQAILLESDGTVSRTFERVSDARFVETGELVLLRQNGEVEWESP